MKVILNLSLIGLLCLTLVGCTKDNSFIIGEESKYAVSDDLVSLRVKEGSLTKSKATFILENNTDYAYSFGNPFSLEKEVDDIWYKLIPIRELVFTMEAYSLKAKKSKEIEIGWKFNYGKLLPGKYRVIKDVFPSKDLPIEENDMFYIAAEFIIK